MYKRVLVPLDGSKLAECSLHHAKIMVSGFRISEIVILRVVKPLSTNTISILAMAGEKFIAPFEKKDLAEAECYTTQIVQKLNTEGIPAKGDVVVGDLTVTILDYVSKNQFDLVIISSHWGSGISQRNMGRIFDRIMDHCPIPVLLIPPLGAA